MPSFVFNTYAGIPALPMLSVCNAFKRKMNIDDIAQL